ncbi:MAG: hypothetical protein AB1589_09470 [Cyanobacteriota bacterium]
MSQVSNGFPFGMAEHPAVPDQVLSVVNQRIDQKVEAQKLLDIQQFAKPQSGIAPKAFVTTPLRLGTNFKVQSDGLLIDIFPNENPGNIQNWVEVRGNENAPFDWHGYQEDWLAVLQGSIRLEVIEIPEISLDSVYEDIIRLKSENKPITLADLRATGNRTYQELKQADLTRIIEISAPSNLDVKNIPILVIPRGVFHADLTPESCSLLNLGKTFPGKSEYLKLDYETFAR